MMRPTLTSLAVLLAMAPLAASAQPVAGTPERVRGTLASVQGDTLVLHGAGGEETVRMTPGWTVRATTPATLAAITPGMAIGVVSRGPATHPVAVAIQVFPPEAAPRRGQSAWDMLPESTMTNATVAGDVTASGEHGLTLKTDDKVIPMEVAPDANIGIAKAGEKAMLTPGVKLVVFATRTADGIHVGRLAIVGLDDSTPPL